MLQHISHFKFNLFITRGQLIVTTERKRERLIYFFRVRAERKKMSGSKGLKNETFFFIKFIGKI
jgi:hypothetical protein